eukprot:comp22704_c0_seq1/m.35234 comp22704_c0_seq1/g.35234  ORF comp22704_c0_seq1/g.35234 comp22704_c0_seq1/m.35234 type:complete len:417 (-) comp22704_c0_seq1:31-1281(-)
MRAGYPCLTLHGGMDQADRDSTLEDFKAGNITLMVATSVAARGLDVKKLNLVVNYDVPNHYEDYVHRCGRTGRAGNKGTAFTFITPEQDRYAGEIMKALELSAAEVPQELKDLWAGFKAKKEAGLATEAGSGFGGHGFKFDQSEADKGKDQKTLQRAIAGGADSDEEDELDDEIEKILRASRKTGDDQKKAMKAIGAPGASTTAGLLPQPTTTTAIPTAVIVGPGGVVPVTNPAVAALINPQAAATSNLRQGIMTDAAAAGAAAFLSGGSVAAGKGAAKAAQIAAMLNAKKGFAPAAPLAKPNLAAASRIHFEDELEINDFPQNARWKVTHKDAVRDIQEYSGAALTVKGTYYPPGKEQKEGMDRKLYLLVEADEERKVKLAVLEIKRLLKEEMEKAQRLGLSNLGRPGKYSITMG